MAWKKQGLIFVPDGSQPWARSHAAVPTVDVLSERVWRIYYATRDGDNRSRISYIDVEAGNPGRVLYRHGQPILPLGALGAFDDAGMMPSSIVNHEGRKYLYYTGWNVRQSVPYHNAIGLAVSEDDGESFRRYGEGPVLGLTVNEPYFTATATVRLEGDRWRNWYAVCTRWEMIDGHPEPFYHLKYAESRNGVDWDRRGHVAIDYRGENEAGIVRAAVIADEGGYRMWYATRQGKGYRHDRAQSYRIGYAESADGLVWERLDAQAGIDASEAGWDSEMIAYPCVIVVGGRKFLFYNGNGFGRSGIGYAEWA